MDFVPHVRISRKYYDFWILEINEIVSQFEYVRVELFGSKYQANEMSL